MPQRSIDGHRARPARGFENAIHTVALFLRRGDQIRRRLAHGGAMRRRVPRHHDAAVVRHVQPFVCVGGPRIGTLDSVHVLTQRAAGSGPQPKGSVDMQPRAMPADGVDDVDKWIEGPGVDVAGLRAHDRGIA